MSASLGHYRILQLTLIKSKNLFMFPQKFFLIFKIPDSKGKGACGDNRNVFRWEIFSRIRKLCCWASR